MEVSKEMLEELKCYQCEKYLTCGPIYTRNTSGEGICGQCIVNEDEPTTTRNKQYEIVASKLVFPCTYAQNGCPNKTHFSVNIHNVHEQNCKYRDRICPMGKSGECEWIGPWTRLVEHCQEDHPNNVYTSPCTLQHVITKDSLNAFVVCAFSQLFILHVKVCVKSAKIYHSLRYLGNPIEVSNYKYKLDVQRNEIILSTPGKVICEGMLILQINSSLALCVNSLLGFLGGYEGTTFTVTIQKVDTPAALLTKVFKITCLKCAKDTKNVSKICDECQSQSTIIIKMKCIRYNIGCKYKANENERVIHERYFCLYRSSCFLCNKKTEIGKIQQHYLDAHKDVTYHIGSTFRINQGTKTMLHKYCLLESTLGKLICWYTLNGSHFDIDIITPYKLHKYQCVINITNPKSKHNETFILTESVASNSHWSTRIERSKVPSNKKRFDLVVKLIPK